MSDQALVDEHALALKQRPVVVKLGGSVVRSAELPAWLDAIAASPLPIVIVPGGGALADEVRAAQARLGFGDGAAHRMALLAMDQLAWAVAGLRAGFEVGDTEEALRASLAHGRVAVWAPYSLVAERSDIIVECGHRYVEADGRRLVAAGVRGFVDEHRPVTAGVGHTAHAFALWSQTERPLIEAAGFCHVGRWQRRDRCDVRQHVNRLPSASCLTLRRVPLGSFAGYAG